MKVFNNKIVSLIGTYFLLLIAAIGVHWYFIYSGAYFTEAWADSFKQIAHYYPYLQREFAEGNFFWSWSNGLGGDLLGGLSYYYTTSPFFWLLMLFPSFDHLIDIFEWRLIISVAKLFIAMVLMFHLLRYLKLLKTSSVLGSIIYGGSVFFTFYSFRYDFMIDGMIYLPLLIWALEWTMDKRKPWFLIGAVFITVCGNFYLAFINSVFLGLYAILKYFIMNEKYSFASFIKYMLRFAGMYFIGLMLSCFVFLPAVYSFINVDRFYYEASIPLLFSWDFYKAMPYELFFSINQNFSFVIAFPIIVFLLFPLGFFFKGSAERKRFAFSLFICLLVLIPFSYSFFNGLSAIQYRWLYLFIFTAAMISAFVVDQLIKGKFNNRLIVAGIVCLFLLLVVGLYFKYELIGVDVTDNDLMIVGMAFITAVLLILLTRIRKLSWKNLVIFVLLAVLLFNTFYINNLMFKEFLSDVEPLKEKQENLLQSYATSAQQEIINEIQREDNGFYRILWDRVREINAPMLLDYKGYGVYSSLVSGNIHRFMKVSHNTLHQNAPSMYSNLDNRLYLETALANKYYIKSKDSTYTPYGYSFKYAMDSYEVYENEYALPIGFLYDKVYDQDDFNALTYAERDQLLLKAAVVDDPTESGLPVLNNEQLVVEEKAVSLADITLSNASILEDKLIRVENEGILSFDNPWKDEPGEVMIELKIRETSKSSFRIGYGYKVFQDGGEGTIYNYPRERIAINLVNHDQDKIHLWLGAGTYEISDILLTFNSYDEYKQLAESKKESSLENVTYTSRSVKGQISAEDNSILFMSIPYSVGWKVKVDGETVDSMEVNSAFIGIPITEGTHEVELVYTTPYFVRGSIISVGTLFVLIVCWFIKRRKVKQ